MISATDRQAAVELIGAALAAGARQRLACRELGIAPRTLQRWVCEGAVRCDARPAALRPTPANKLSAHERAEVLRTVQRERTLYR